MDIRIELAYKYCAENFLDCWEYEENGLKWIGMGWSCKFLDGQRYGGWLRINPLEIKLKLLKETDLELKKQRRDTLALLFSKYKKSKKNT